MKLRKKAESHWTNSTSGNMYAIVDLETTGGNAKFGKITEIAVYIHDGFQIVDEFLTLINPECPIPAFITRLTGITNEMVEDAPRFYEVAKKVVEITEGNVFVAHNAGFDYNFLQWEFRRLGYHFERDTLCTVKLSRKILPGFPSYSLGKLVGHFGMTIKDRHRASGDAFATVRLLEILQQKAGPDDFASLISRQALPGRINDFLAKEAIDSLPNNIGVYYFFDHNHDLLYIGKSKDIRTRVIKHLVNPKSRKARELREKVAEVQYELTGNELLALLKESQEIKQQQPPYNQTQRRNSFRFGIFAELQLDGFIHFRFGRSKGLEPIVACSTEEEARTLLYKMSKKYALCLQKCGLEKQDSSRPCFHHSIQYCNGACIGKEPATAYNERAQKAMKTSIYEHADFLILDKGRSDEELSVVKIENGRYRGYGYADATQASNDLDYLKDCTKNYIDNREVSRIILAYLHKSSAAKVVKF